MGERHLCVCGRLAMELVPGCCLDHVKLIVFATEQLRRPPYTIEEAEDVWRVHHPKGKSAAEQLMLLPNQGRG